MVGGGSTGHPAAAAAAASAAPEGAAAAATAAAATAAAAAEVATVATARPPPVPESAGPTSFCVEGGSSVVVGVCRKGRSGRARLARLGSSYGGHDGFANVSDVRRRVGPACTVGVTGGDFPWVDQGRGHTGGRRGPSGGRAFVAGARSPRAGARAPSSGARAPGSGERRWVSPTACLGVAKAVRVKPSARRGK